MRVIQFHYPVLLSSGKEITEVTITDTMCHAGTLRGLKMWDLATGDVNALITLLPRVTSPRIDEQSLADMHPACFSQLSNEVSTFLVPGAPSGATQEQEN